MLSMGKLGYLAQAYDSDSAVNEQVLNGNDLFCIVPGLLILSIIGSLP